MCHSNTSWNAFLLSCHFCPLKQWLLKKKKKVFQKSEYLRQYKHFIGFQLAKTGGQGMSMCSSDPLPFRKLETYVCCPPQIAVCTLAQNGTAAMCLIYQLKSWGLRVPARIWPGFDCTLPTDACMSGTCMTWADSLEQPLGMRGCRPSWVLQYCLSKAAKWECLSKEQEIWGWWVKDVLAVLNSHQLVVLLQPQCKCAAWSGASSWSRCRSEIWAPESGCPWATERVQEHGGASWGLWAEAWAGTHSQPSWASVPGVCSGTGLYQK